MGKAMTNINIGKVKVSADILRALTHPLRLEILDFIDKNTTVNVKSIYNELDLKQSITSQHLQILRRAGLVITKRDGKFINYSLDYSKIEEAVKAIDRFSNEIAE
ncbi:MAG TPA: transcriptional regulator [Saprospiraceae bacterium]|nr:transcriptional regulator [Saprospiraceae bacterium]